MTALFDLDVDEHLGSSIDYEQCFDLPWHDMLSHHTGPSVGSLPSSSTSNARCQIQRPKFLPKGRRKKRHANILGNGTLNNAKSTSTSISSKSGHAHSGSAIATTTSSIPLSCGPPVLGLVVDLGSSTNAKSLPLQVQPLLSKLLQERR